MVMEPGGLIAQFAVRGKPEPRGSKASRAIYVDYKRKIPKRYADGTIMTSVYDSNDAASKKWMKAVALAAGQAYRQPPVEGVGLDVVLTFFVWRPEGQHGTGKNIRLVKDSSPARPIVTPDFDKLARPVLDALTGVVWKDDSQVVGGSIDKWYAVPRSAEDNGEGVVVKVGLAPQQKASDLDIDVRQRWVAGAVDAEPEGLFAN